MTLFSAQASEHATTVDQALTAERRSAVQLATRLIVDGMPGRAQYEMARSLVRQGRIAGLGTQVIEPVCPCGGRCTS